MSPTQEWPHRQKAFSVQISSEIAHESIVTLKASLQRVYIMRDILKEEEVEREREETHIKPGKVKKSFKEVEITKLNYHKGWHVATNSVGARNVSPQNTPPGLWKSVLRSTMCRRWRSQSAASLLPAHPKYPPSKTPPNAAHLCTQSNTITAWGVCALWLNFLRLPELFLRLDY